MEKQEILEKSKNENKHGDELYISAYNQSARFAMAIGVLICSLINLLDVIMNDELSALGLSSSFIMISMWFSLYVTLAAKCKKRSDIIISIVFGILLVCFIVLMIIYICTGRFN